MTTLSDRSPIARKTHQCLCCYQTIRAGEMYHRQVNVIDGEFQQWITCDPCRGLYATVHAYCQCDYVSVDCYEEWAHETYEHSHETPTQQADALAYLKRRNK